MSSFRGRGNPNLNPNNPNNPNDPNIDPNIDPDLSADFNAAFPAGLFDSFPHAFPDVFPDVFPDAFPADLNPGPNTGPTPGPDSSTGANTTSTSTSTATATASTPQGSHWKQRGIYQPDSFTDQFKALCGCSDHRVGIWPLNHAELVIAPCAYRCPFCDEFNKVGRVRLMASNLRRHITKTHIEGNADLYGTLVVAPGGAKARGQ
ncbi:hypothetical protein N7465_004560 [Penicillium sp. CMV-2018d]|nr:hypothetical protein N7465_004560 [Penicillium sp. CMV-2018d]